MKANINSNKHLLGLIYGLVGGLAFAVFAWGIDAWLLAKAHSTFFWVKFIPGLIVCLLAGGLAGWLTIRFDRHWAALLIWGLLALLFSWLIVWLPLDAAPYLIKVFDPHLTQWLNYSEVEQLVQFRITGFLIVGLAAILSGLLEINLVEHARTTPYGLASAAIMLVCVFSFGLAGSASDQLININLREPVEVVDNLIQFAADNQGKEVPVDVARKIHLSALNAVTDLDDLLEESRQLTLVSFDPALGMMDIIVDFDGSLVKCTAIYAQPANCIRLAETY